MRCHPCVLLAAALSLGCEAAPCWEIVQADRVTGTLRLDLSRSASRAQHWQLVTEPADARYQIGSTRDLRMRRANAAPGQCAPPAGSAVCAVTVRSGRYAWSDVRRAFDLDGLAQPAAAVQAPRLEVLTLKFPREEGLFSLWDGEQRVGTLVMARVRRHDSVHWAELWAFDVEDVEPRLGRIRAEREAAVARDDLPHSLDVVERAAVARRAYHLVMEPPEACSGL